jgi:thiol-disulfide isomerase/thioredoxin
MPRAALVPTLLALTLMPFGRAAGDPALDLLQRTAQVYRSVGQLQIEGEIRADIKAGEREQTTLASFRVAVGTNRRIHDELRHPQAGLMRVSNGQRMWVYVEPLGQYVEQAADTVDYTRPQQGGGVLGALMAALRHMDDGVETVKALPDETLSFGGEKRPCAVVEVRYRSGNAALMSPNAPRTFWIDRKRHLVLQHRTVGRVTAADGSTAVEQTETFHYTRIVLDRPPPDSLFAFRAPAGSQRVEQFRSGNQPIDLSGQEAADFTLPDLDGQQHHLASLRGKVVLLDFWATWCGPCRRQMPLVEKLGEEFKDKDLVVYAVNQGEASETARSFIDKNRYTTTTLLDQKGDVGRQYKVSGIPTLVIIGRDGKIAAHFVGVHSEEQLREGLKKAGL